MRQIVITEKTDQARNVRDAIGGSYGEILPAEGTPDSSWSTRRRADSRWKRWGTDVLYPGGLYGTRPAAKTRRQGGPRRKLEAIARGARDRRVRVARDRLRPGGDSCWARSCSSTTGTPAR